MGADMVSVQCVQAAIWQMAFCGAGLKNTVIIKNIILINLSRDSLIFRRSPFLCSETILVFAV